MEGGLPVDDGSVDGHDQGQCGEMEKDTHGKNKDIPYTIMN